MHTCMYQDHENVHHACLHHACIQVVGRYMHHTCISASGSGARIKIHEPVPGPKTPFLFIICNVGDVYTGYHVNLEGNGNYLRIFGLLVKNKPFPLVHCFLNLLDSSVCNTKYIYKYVIDSIVVVRQ